jgi:EamA domain-containing membrane protein RarD
METLSNRYFKDQMFLAGVALSVLSLMALFFLVVSWLAGGDTFMATINGKPTMVALLASTVIGGVAMAIFKEPGTPLG